MNHIQAWFQISLTYTLLLVSTTTPVRSQIIPDTSLGAESSVLTPNVPVDGVNADRIDGGAQRGSNLFHSFSQFNINNDQKVYFSNPIGVQNILTRVTGTQVSNILGTLGVDGNANLFLINPNGIIFGQNARLDVGNSFIGTTANGVRFGEQGIFGASSSEAPPLLTIQPSALLFNQINDTAFIENNSIAPAGLDPTSSFNTFGLRVLDGRSLLLLGGDVRINSGGIVAFDGHIDIGGVKGTGSVELNQKGDSFSLKFPSDLQRANVSLTDGAGLIVSAGGGGNVILTGNNINISQNSSIEAGILGGLGLFGRPAGDITLDATGVVTVSNNSYISNILNFGAVGNSGNINIKAERVSIDNGGILSASTFGEGNAGSVNITALDTVFLDDGTGNSFIFNNVLFDAVGNSGGINIATGSFTVKNGAQIQSRTLGQGNSGKVTILARDTVTLDGRDSNAFSSGIFSQVNTSGQGNSGGIDITTGSVFIQNGGLLNSSTFGQGDAGRIEIKARDTVSLSGQGRSIIENDVGFGGIGNSGGISINTGSLFLSDKAFISSNVDGRGNSGGVEIVARDLVSLDDPGELALGSQPGTLILSRVNDGAVGNGGDINIKTGSLLAFNSQINTSTFGQGSSGSVIIEARDRVALLRSTEIFTEVGCPCETDSGIGGIGNAGDIRIKTGLLFLDGGSNLRADTESLGNAGNIIIEARDSITFSGSLDGFTSGAFSQVEPQGVGRGGDIFITTPTLSLSGNHEINTRTQGQGDAGNIFINADSISLAGSNVRIISSASQEARFPGTSGNGGDINITTGALLVTEGAQVTANTEIGGFAGDITINTSRLVLDNQGSIKSESVANADGGNITLNARNLVLMRRNSSISTNAGTDQAGGNGGNININTPFIVGVPQENSDISANAFSGKGGNVNIRVQSIFGIQGRSKASLETSDITASSDLGVQGEISITQLEIQPTQELIELPDRVLDASNQIAQTTCSRRVVAGRSLGEFFVTGRGSLPPSPLEPLAAYSDLVALAT
ncbi:hypothetical protein NUACC21_53230 [Scytonema sp. NUACC21]